MEAEVRNLGTVYSIIIKHKGTVSLTAWARHNEVHIMGLTRKELDKLIKQLEYTGGRITDE